MRLELRTEGVLLTDGLRAHVERKLYAALGRFGRRVRRVRVRLTDVNGPRRGEDIRCHIQASVLPGGTLIVEEQRCDPFEAVARASGRVRRRLTRHLERRKQRQRGR